MKKLIALSCLLLTFNIFSAELSPKEILNKSIGMESLCTSAQNDLKNNKVEILDFHNTKLKVAISDSNKRHKIIRVTDSKNNRYHLVFIRHDNFVIQKIETYDLQELLLSKFVATQSVKDKDGWMISHARVGQTEVSCPVQNK